MNSTIVKFLRRSLYCLLLLLAVLVILASIFFSQLDLDDYRHELEQELSTALEQPVRIGRSKLTFHKGIALRLQDLRIGPPDALLVDVGYLTATLEIAPLFDGRLVLKQVVIDSPSLQIWLPILDRPERGVTHQLTDKFGIHTLSIRDAKLKIHQRLQNGSRELLSLAGLNAELSSWQPGQTASLLVSGELHQAGQAARFQLDLTLPSSPDPSIWRNDDFDYRFSISHLATGLSGRTGQKTLPTNIDLGVSVKGVPAAGARIEAELVSSNGDEQLLTLSGRWNSTAEQESITNLSGDLLGLPLNGEIVLLRQADRQLLAGRLGATDINLTSQQLARWRLPDENKLLAGKLERLALVLEKSWPTGQPMDGLPRIGAEITLSDLEWEENNLQRVQAFSTVLSLENQVLDIQKGLLTAARQPINFSGQIDSLFTQPKLDLKIDLKPQLSELLGNSKLPSGWKIDGEIPTSLHLNGALQQPDFLLQTDLTGATLALGQVLQKVAAKSSGLTLAGSLDAEQVQLDRLDLKLPGLSITGNGCFTYDPDSDFFLLDIDPINLSQLQALSPLLKTLRIQGTLQPNIIRGENGATGRLQLTDVGAHLKNIVGDLNRTTGQIDIDRQGLKFKNLKTAFGKSDFVLSGSIGDWENARLNLKLQSKKVNAGDLIFRNQKLHLYDLNGRLQIDGKGIVFDQIKVRLEKETRVVVNGKLDSFRDPQVILDIAGKEANIDQVIDLFIGPRKTPEPKKKVEHRPLIITARVKKGSIGNLRFENAEGLIKDHRGVFTIYPLTFQSHKGSCQARVELDRNHPDSLLKISGHAEEFDASGLYQEMFEKRGLVSGTLRGDFYLEGRPAKGKFWHNVTGGVYVQIKDGTLRKFRSLARVFSLLNVSQLFSGKLPDMDREGMPFTLLEGSVQVAAGRAKTEDLRINSVAMNMSLIGSQSLIEDSINFNLGVMPLRTVDKVITSIPIAGWVLAGEDKALLTAHFKIEGSSEAPEVTPIPISSVSDTVFGIFKRTFGLPGKVVKDIGSLLKNKPQKKAEPDN